MEDLLATQQQIIGAIEQLYVNFKKDGSERRTGDYFKRRLETLEKYWREFQDNHVSLCGYGIRSHDYFSQKQFEQTKEKIEYIRSKIQGHQVREMKTATPLLRAANPLGGATEKPNPGTSLQGTSNENVASPQTITFRAQGIHSRTDELLRKQASNFRAFQRKVTSIDLDTVTEKWEFDDILRTLQSRWSLIDSLHLEIDSELEGKNQEYDTTFYHYEQIYEDIKKSINKKI